MSDSEEEDPIENIDFSVISTAIETGGNTLDQILNAVHYGSPEVRQLLRESCDYIFECKHCKSLFRSIPNFVAHKRIYCGDKSMFQNIPKKKKSKKHDEVVIVRPVSPSLSVTTATTENEVQKSVLEQILTGTFQGNSESYKNLTEAASHVENQKLQEPTVVVNTKAIKNTTKAVNVGLEERPTSQVASNATQVIAKAKKAQKQPLTKIVDTLKSTAVSTSPRKTPEKMSVTEVDNAKKVPKSETENKRKSSKNRPNEQKDSSTNGSKTPKKSVTSPKKLSDVKSQTGLAPTEKIFKKPEETALKQAKIVLRQLPDLSKSQTQLQRKEAAQKEEISKLEKSNENIQVQVVKPSSLQLRPVKTKDGSELSELSQLGHCDLDQLKCLICNLQYTQKKTLLQHMHVIHSNTKKKYPCNMCRKTFDYFWGLTRHLLLNHKQTKEQIDRMRPELRELAYTVTETDETESTESENTDSSSKAAKPRHGQKAIVQMFFCDGCKKSFWKKINFIEHKKQCSFFARLPSAESGMEGQDDKKGKSDENDENKESSTQRLRNIKGKFTTKEDVQKVSKEDEAKNKYVKKLKEKSRSYVPPQRFIRTRRATAFYHSPAQRTRFHDQKRAVISSPRKDSRSPSKSPRKGLDDVKSSQTSDEATDQNIKLQMARKNLLQAIEKGKQKDLDDIAKKPSSQSGKSVDGKAKLTDTDTGRARSKTRTLQGDKSVKADISRGSSVESTRSKKSTRSLRDSSRESVRSRQSIRLSEISTSKGKEREKSTQRESSTESLNRSRSRTVVAKAGDKPAQRESSTESLNRSRSRTVVAKAGDKPAQRESSTENFRSRTRKDRTESTSQQNISTETSDVSRTQRTGLKEDSSKAKKDIPENEKPHKIETRQKSSPKEEKVSSKNVNTFKDLKNEPPMGIGEIDGVKTGEKYKPKWSSKDWSNKPTAQKEQLKGVSKPKIAKTKAKYKTRSLKTKLQAAKKVGEIRKKYVTRISTKQNDIETEKVDAQKKVTQSKDNSKVTGSKDSGSGQNEDNVKSDSQSSQRSQGVTRKWLKQTSLKNIKRESLLEKLQNLVQSKSSEPEKPSNPVPKTSGYMYTHRKRNKSDQEHVQVIEEIWVAKEPGKPLHSVKHKKTIIDSPKKKKSGRMYVSSETEKDKSKCLDFSRINHLVDYKNNKCLQCGLELTDISSLRRHAVRHLGWKRYKCKLCAYTGFNRSECNSHIKRRHAEKLVLSGTPLASFIIDLNKEASDIRTKKKKSTLRRKNTAEKAETKVGKEDEQKKTPKLSRRNSLDDKEKIIEEGQDKEVKIVPARRSRSSSDISAKNVVIETKDNETKTRKRKRDLSNESLVGEIKGDNVSVNINQEKSQGKPEVDASNEAAGDVDKELEDIGSVSDYEDSDRNLSSPTLVKVNPNVALMMATLEEARATKFSRGKKGRGGIRRLSSPLKPQAGTTGEEGFNSSREEDMDELDATIDKTKASECPNDGQLKQNESSAKDIPTSTGANTDQSDSTVYEAEDITDKETIESMGSNKDVSGQPSVTDSNGTTDGDKGALHIKDEGCQT